MSDGNPETELARLFRDTSREQTLSVVCALLEIELERARTDARQAKTRVDAARKQLRRVRALETKAAEATREWFAT